MRAVFLVVSLAPLSAQIYREPFRPNRSVTVVEPPNGMPLAVDRATINQPLGDATALVSSLTIRPIPISGITLRVAMGPMPDGMLTYRLRAAVQSRIDRDDPPARLLPHMDPVMLTFQIVPEDPRPPLLAFGTKTMIVLTVDRIEDEEGQPIFENPDSRELLWEALGRPSFSRH